MQDLIEYLLETDNGLSQPPSGDGSFSTGDGDVDFSWGLSGVDFEELKRILQADPDRIMTVIDPDDDINLPNDAVWWVTPGFHYVNRMFYLVADKPVPSDHEDWTL